MESDTSLLSLLGNRDKYTFHCLYECFAPVLYGVILEATSNTKVAERILIDSFVEAWQKFPSFDPSKGRLWTWMLTITLRQCREALCLPISWYIRMYQNQKFEHDSSIHFFE